MNLDANERSAELIALLEPVIAAHMAKAPKPEPVVIEAEAEVMRAARAVATAVTQVEQSRFTGKENQARSALWRAAKEQRDCMKERRRHGRG